MASQTKKLSGLRDSFQGAREYQQIEGLQSQVENLQAEVASLKSQELDSVQQSQLEGQIEQLRTVSRSIWSSSDFSKFDRSG